MKTVCIDAGHYAKYNRSPVIPEYWESERMWKLAELLADALKKKGIAVVKTRTNQAFDLALTSRGKKAKDCDLFVSLHSNAASKESVDYVVSYVPLNGKGNDIGKRLADCVADVMDTTQAPRINTRKGSTGGDYYGVIRGATSVGVPGIILEHSFHTNKKATQWLMLDSNLAKLAKAEADCIAAWLNVQKTETTKPTTTTKPVTSQKVDPAKSFARGYAKSYKTTTALNMRTGAGTGKALIKTLPKGAKFTCYGYYTEVDGVDWLYGVDSAGKTGFCSKKYLK